MTDTTLREDEIVVRNALFKAVTLEPREAFARIQAEIERQASEIERLSEVDRLLALALAKHDERVAEIERLRRQIGIVKTHMNTRCDTLLARAKRAERGMLTESDRAAIAIAHDELQGYLAVAGDELDDIGKLRWAERKLAALNEKEPDA